MKLLDHIMKAFRTTTKVSCTTMKATRNTKKISWTITYKGRKLVQVESTQYHNDLTLDYDDLSDLGSWRFEDSNSP